MDLPAGDGSDLSGFLTVHTVSSILTFALQHEMLAGDRGKG